MSHQHMEYEEINDLPISLACQEDAMQQFELQELVEALEAENVQKLKELISTLLQLIKGGEIFEIRKNGKVISHVIPVDKPKRDTSDAWKNLERLSAELSSHWPANVNAVDAIRDVRREM